MWNGYSSTWTPPDEWVRCGEEETSEECIHMLSGKDWKNIRRSSAPWHMGLHLDMLTLMELELPSWLNELKRAF